MSDLATIYSHPGKPLKDHLQGVIDGTQVRAENKLAKLAAFFHDIGKINPNFQKKLLPNTKVKGYSQHAFLSAYIFHLFALKHFKFLNIKPEQAITLKAIIAKHHVDLPNLNQNFIDFPDSLNNPFEQLKNFILQNNDLLVSEYIDETKELIDFDQIQEVSLKNEKHLNEFKIRLSKFSNNDHDPKKGTN
jgi:CRISPR-associated endonuclease/helicase Cas3